MASYLQATDPRIYQVTPFMPDREGINRALMYRQGKYDEGVARIQGIQQNMLNLDVSNDENKARLSEYNKKAKEELNRLSKSDFSLRDNVAAAERIFEPITNDKYILNDIATTKFFKQQFSVANDLKGKDKGAGYNLTNLRYVQNSYNKFVNAKGDEQFGIEKREYVPYTDAMAEISTLAEKMKVKVTKDITAPGGYIVTQENGSAAYGPLRDLFYSNLSDAAKNQLRIESTVGYEDATAMLGEDVAATEVAGRYNQSLSRQNSEASKKLATVRKNIKEIEDLGDKATIQQKEYLDLYKEQESILDANYKGSAKTMEKMKSWTTEDYKKYAPQLANEMYVESRAHNWARSYADATSSFKINKDQAYWTGMELNRNLRKDQMDYEIAMLKERNSKEGKAPEAPQDPRTVWTGLGTNKMPEERLVDYTSITKSMFGAEEDLLGYKRGILDNYWGKKAEGGVEIYSKLSKAVENGSGKLKLADLSNNYASDRDITTTLDMEKYSKALGVPMEELRNMSVQEVFNRMNSGFNDYLTNAESVPSADIKPYEYKQELKKREELYDYYRSLWSNINKDASSKIEKRDIEIAGKLKFNESIFLNSNGTLKTKSEVVEELSKKGIESGMNTRGAVVATGSRPANSTLAPETFGQPRESKNLNTRRVLGVADIQKSYDDFAKRYNKSRNDSAKNLSKNIEYTKYFATNNPKEVQDAVDIVARKLSFNFEGPNIANFQDQFDEEEMERYLPRVNNVIGNAVSSVEMTPYPDGNNEYVLKFDREELKKIVDSKDAKGMEFVEKLVTKGITIKSPDNIPELNTTRDVSRFLVDNDKNIQRKFGEGYNFSVFRTNSPTGNVYNVTGSRTVPEIGADGKLVIENGRIKFKKEPVDIPLDVTKNTVDNYLKNLTDTFYKMNAIYVFANRSDVLEKLAKDPTYIQNLSQLTALAAAEYKLDLNTER